MGGGGGKSRDIQQRAAADGEEIRVPVYVVAVNLRVEFADDRGGFLADSLPETNNGGRNQPQAGRRARKNIFESVFQFGRAWASESSRTTSALRGRVREDVPQTKFGFVRIFR